MREAKMKTASCKYALCAYVSKRFRAVMQNRVMEAGSGGGNEAVLTLSSGKLHLRRLK
jgi:hypothetical protein